MMSRVPTATHWYRFVIEEMGDVCKHYWGVLCEKMWCRACVLCIVRRCRLRELANVPKPRHDAKYRDLRPVQQEYAWCGWCGMQ